MVVVENVSTMDRHMMVSPMAGDVNMSPMMAAATVCGLHRAIGKRGGNNGQHRNAQE